MTVVLSKTVVKSRGSLEFSSGAVSVELNSTMAIMMATPGPSMLMAVPAIVWSAPSFTVAMACSMPNRAPAKPAQRKPSQALPVK